MRKKIKNELDYLKISVKKTGGHIELESWSKIKKFIDNYYENKKKR